MAKKICKEKECEACGAWFTPSRSNVKYCPNCRTHSDQIVRQMERNTQRNIDRYGYGQKNKKIQNVCKECGKIFISYLQPKDFCSKRCGDTYLVKHTSCAYCKKPMTMDDDVHDVKYGTWLCSDTCKEKWAWVIARKEKLKKEKQKKQAEEKLQKYIQKNGLCSICKTSYVDCERMQSNFRCYPKGSSCKGNLVIKCPKFTK